MIWNKTYENNKIIFWKVSFKNQNFKKHNLSN